MDPAVNLWPLLGIAVVIAGFLLRFNPLLAVCAAGVVTGLAAGMPALAILAKLGQGFMKTRNITLILLLVLPVVGLMERHGLRDQARAWIRRIRNATVGRLLIVYLLVRELSAALGLTGLGGHPQMVRPILAPMTEGAWEQRHGEPTPEQRQKLRAMCAATDNVGLFFGEDIFVAFGAVMLMHTFLQENQIPSEPLHIALWGIPTALFAFIIHAVRLMRLERQLLRQAAPAAHLSEKRA
ncbi:DUF969 family protein [Chromobacterium subtsugae]|uniref:DUF969 family protein n=1 Tax=Chromobacterium subtsugae TaxID=251747 RepID=A0ABS7FI60_9NEIS|nr:MULTISPECIES: DUF969 domain-containing protein [Chromobacterium]KUM01627.1 hypothetical protein Cv017_07120 [Chromobacterium subtsugae]KZE87280.1 hypothetical protein AWB61_13160 [Chromobacterium sp. F49]MBW7568325.1 DUF969 domain-containing protein [Chromobacterium subtsugae]MBW8289411.1 DUF969 family protein [Chromobacterium subtsugae]OBU88061.1 membrane protein [Chromobacterium subtsugae]